MNKFGQRPPAPRRTFATSPVVEKSFPAGMNFTDKQLQQREAKQTKEQIELEQSMDRLWSSSRSLQEERMYSFTPWGFGRRSFGWF